MLRFHRVLKIWRNVKPGRNTELFMERCDKLFGNIVCIKLMK